MFLRVGLPIQLQLQSLDPVYGFCARGMLTYEYLKIYVVFRLHIFLALSMAPLIPLSHIWFLLVYDVLLDAISP